MIYCQFTLKFPTYEPSLLLDKKKGDASRVKVALDLVEQALLADETNSDAHRWQAILSNAHTEALGKRQQVENRLLSHSKSNKTIICELSLPKII